MRIRFSEEGREVLSQAFRESVERLNEMRNAGVRTEEEFKEYRSTLRDVAMAKRDMRREIQIANEGFYDTVRVLQDVGGMFRMVSGMITQYNVAQIRIRDATKDVAEAQKDLARAQERYNQIITESWEKSDNYRSAVEAINRAVEGEKESSEKVREAEERLARVKEGALAEANRRVAEAQARYNSELERERGITEDITRAEISRERIAMRITELQERINKLAREGKVGTDEYKKAQLDLKEAQLDLADADERLMKLREEQKELPSKIAEAEKRLADETKKAEEERAKKVADAEKEVEKAREGAKKKSEEVAKAQSEFLEKQTEWEKKHAEAVGKASENIEKAQERVEKSTRNLSQAHNALNMQLVSFALYGVPQVLSGIANLSRDLSILTGTTASVSGGFGGLISGLGGFPGAIASLFSGPLLLAIAGVAAAVVGLKIAWDNNLGGIQEKVGGFIEDVKKGFGGVFDFLKDVWEEAKPAVFDALGGSIEDIGSVLGDLWGMFKETFSWLAATFGPYIKEGLILILQGLAGTFRVIAFLIREAWEALKGFVSFIQGIADTIRGVFDWLGGIISGARQAQSEIGNIHPPEGAVTPGMEAGVGQYGMLVPITGRYRLERGEIVMTQQMLSDLVGFSRRFAEVAPYGGLTRGGQREVAININAPLIRVEGHMDEKLAKDVSKYVLREMRRIIS